MALRAERKSEKTVRAYGEGIRGCWHIAPARASSPVLDRATVSEFVASLLGRRVERGNGRAAAAGRAPVLRLADRGGLHPADGLLGIRPPKLDDPNVPSLSDGELAALIRACDGQDVPDRRDEAIVRLSPWRSAARAEEILVMTVTDVDLAHGMAVIQRGKGGRGPPGPVRPQTAQALDRYIRLRRATGSPGTAALWLGDRGKELGYYGLRMTLRRRATAAGIKGFHITSCGTRPRPGGSAPGAARAA